MSEKPLKEKQEKTEISRRSFAKKTAVAGAGIAAMTSAPFAPSVLGANEKVVMGTIGCGGQGSGVSYGLMGTGRTQWIAACDVDQSHLDRFVNRAADEHKMQCKAFKDFRELLEIKEIDAVMIGTPDHWHALPFIYACEAGKDVYLEKPVSHNIVEGRAMVNAAKKYKRVVQIGSWQRSVQHFQDAIDFVRSGKLGDISVCRAWLNNNSNGVGHVPASEPPQGFDWDMWLGPAPFKLYRSNMNHWNWRWFFDYAGGQTADWGVHMMDIVCLAMGEWDPTEVTCVGGTFVIDDDRDTPDTQIATYRFPNWVLHWEVRWGNGRGLDGFGSGHGSEWIGRNGTLGADRGKWEFFAEREEFEERPQTENEIKVSHYDNFIDCIASRGKPRSDIESMHKTTVLCHLANIAYRTGKKLEWNADREVITNEPGAMNCPQYQREYRAPWSLPMHTV